MKTFRLLSDKYLAFRGIHVCSKIIFIVGTGRAGTHWLGWTLRGHPDIRVTVEKPAMFNKVVSMALDAREKQRQLKPLIWRYRIEHALSAPRHYVDKSHPNLWLIEELQEIFPRALFIGIKRNAFATVASMLLHKGVRDWCLRWREFPIPNPFLGITEENAVHYPNMSLEARCALRWRAHMDRMDYFAARLGNRMHLAEYERLIENTEEELAKINLFLELETPIPLPLVKRKSLDKWRRQLSATQCRDIEEVAHVKY